MFKIGVDEDGDAFTRDYERNRYEDELPNPSPWLECRECGELVDRAVDMCVDATGVCACCWVSELEESPARLSIANGLALANKCSVIELYEEYGPLPERTMP